MLQALLTFKSPIEKSVVILKGFPLSTASNFPLAASNTLSLLCILSVLAMICLGDIFFYSGLFGDLCASCICLGVPFLSLGKLFSMILLKIWSMPLTWDSSPSSMHAFQKFGFFFLMLSYIPVCPFSIFF